MSTKVKITSILTFAVLLIVSGTSSMATSDLPSASPKSTVSGSPTAPPIVHKGKTTAVSQSSSPPRSILDTIEKALRIVAYIIGALLVYFNFWKGRTYRPRIEPMITGQLLKQERSKLIKIVIKLKNAGLSKVDIHQEGTALRLLSYDSSEVTDLWKHQRTISILLAHKWIEPGETVGEHFLIPLSGHDVIAVKAEVIIVSKKTMWESAIIIT